MKKYLDLIDMFKCFYWKNPAAGNRDDESGESETEHKVNFHALSPLWCHCVNTIQIAFFKKKERKDIFSVSISVIPISRDSKLYMNLTSDNEKNKMK